MSTSRTRRQQRDLKRRPAADALAVDAWPENAIPPEWWVEAHRPIDAESYQRDAIAEANGGSEAINWSKR